MITVTDGAREELEAFFADKEKTPVRVYLAPGGCSGPRLALALDEPRETDQVFEDKGFSFCMESALHEQTQGVIIDAGYMGFSVQPAVPLAQAGSGCSGCGGGCGQ